MKQIFSRINVLIIFIIILNGVKLDRNNKNVKIAEIYTEMNNCSFFSKKDSNYTDYFDLSTIRSNIKSSDIYLNISIYVIGSRYNYIALTQNDSFTDDNEKLEIKLRENIIDIFKWKNGSWTDKGNSHIEDDSLAAYRAKKVTLIIKNENRALIYIDNEKGPSITSQDESFKSLKYISFHSDKFHQIKYIFNCSLKDTNDIYTLNNSALNINENFLEISNDLHVDKKRNEILRKTGRLFYFLAHCDFSSPPPETSSNIIELNKLPNIFSKNNRNTKRITLYVIAHNEIFVALKATPDNVRVLDSNPYYEIAIVVSRFQYARAEIRKDNEVMRQTVFKFIDVPYPKRLVIEIKKNNVGSALIKVFYGNDREPVVSANDPEPLTIKYIAFKATKYNSEYYYNCPDISSINKTSAIATSSFSLHNLPPPGECGTEFAVRIIGGKPSKITEYPWSAQLLYRIGNIFHAECGGALINEKYVITTAHCNKDESRELKRVRLGEYDTSTNPDYIENERFFHQDYDINEIKVHPRYSSKVKQNDIALLRLNQTVQYSRHIRPICLPIDTNKRKINEEGTSLRVAGWGETENATSSSIKLAIDFNIAKNDLCRSKYKQFRLKISSNQFCTGGLERKDTCRGDSGSGLVALDNSNPNNTHYYLVGLVSFGTSDCGREKWPSINTKVSGYINWILNNMYY